MLNHFVKKWLKKSVAIALIATTIIGMFTSTVKVQAHDAYVLLVLSDFERLQYIGYVKTDESWLNSYHQELKYASYARSKFYGENGKELPLDLTKSDWGTTNAASSNSQLTFTFPASESDKRSSEDRDAAQRINSEVLTALNKAISFVFNAANQENKGNLLLSYQNDKTGTNDRINDFFYVTGNLANNRTGGSFEFKGAQFNLVKLNNNTKGASIIPKSDWSQYIEIQHIKNGEVQSSQILRQTMYKYPSDIERGGKSTTINWKHLVYFGNASYLQAELSYTTLDTIEKPKGFQGAVMGVLEDILGGIKGALGLTSIEGLMFNKDTSLWKGIADKGLLEGVNVIFWVCQVLAWMGLMLAIIKLTSEKLWKTVSPGSRVQLITGTQDIMIAAFGLTMIYPVFELIATFNEHLVTIFANSTLTNQMISFSNVSGGGIAGILVSFALLGAEIYFNFFYILRGVTIAILFGISPLFVMAFAFGGRIKPLTGRFIRELVGNIFVQSFHALTLTLFGIYLFGSGTTSMIAKLTIVYSFIPLTALFKTLTGIGESDLVRQGSQMMKSKSDKTIDVAKDTGKTAVIGAATGIAASKSISSSMKNSNSKTEGGISSPDDIVIDGNQPTSNSNLINKWNDSKPGQVVNSVRDSKFMNSKGMNGAKRFAQNTAGTSMYAAGSALGIKELKTAGKGHIEKSWTKKASPGYLGSNYTDTGRKDIYNSEQMSTSDVRMENELVIQRCSLEQQNQASQDFRVALEQGCNSNGQITDPNLLEMGIRSYQKHEDGTADIGFDKKHHKFEHMRKDGNQLYVNRTSKEVSPNLDLYGQASKKFRKK